MKCPTCFAWAFVLNTRPRANGDTSRRYECADGHRFSTVEAVAVLTRGTNGATRKRMTDLRIDNILAGVSRPHDVELAQI